MKHFTYSELMELSDRCKFNAMQLAKIDNFRPARKMLKKSEFFKRMAYAKKLNEVK